MREALDRVREWQAALLLKLGKLRAEHDAVATEPSLGPSLGCYVSDETLAEWLDDGERSAEIMVSHSTSARWT